MNGWEKTIRKMNQSVTSFLKEHSLQLKKPLGLNACFEGQKSWQRKHKQIEQKCQI